MRTVCITGAGGYIGSVAAHLLLHKGYRVVALDNFSTGYREPLELLQEMFGEDKLVWYETSLGEDLSPIFQKEKSIEAVLHYAAFCSVNESMENPGLYFSNNTCSTHNLLHTLERFDIRRIVFSSTCAVYGEAEYVPIDENHPTRPANPYGESKKMSETMIDWYARLREFSYVVLRYFNVCGATDDGLLGDSKKPSVHLMQNAVRGALGIEPFQLTCARFDTPDGTPIRDYVNVVDLNEAHLKALEYLSTGGESTLINLGTGSGNSVMEIVQAVQKITNKPFDVGTAPARKGEYPTMIASTSRAEQVLGWKPARTLEQSVESLMAWYTKRPEGWKK